MFESILDIDGKPCSITVTDLANGKRAVRANGRIVAPPQPGDAIDCWFVVDGANIHLFGSGDALQLERIPVATAEPQDPAERDRFAHVRAVVFTILGISLFFGANAIAILGWVFYSFGRPVREQLLSQSSHWADVFANHERIAFVMRISLFFEALLGVALIISAVQLWKRTEWAPRAIELVLWLIPGVYLFAILMVEPRIHDHVALMQYPDQALLWYSRHHWSTAVWLVFISGGAGALMMFLQRERLEAQ